jgi:two-component system sensor kinase FixL
MSAAVVARAEDDVLLAAVLDSFPDPLVLVDAKGFIRRFNDAACTFFGYDAKDVIGKTLSHLAPTDWAGPIDGAIETFLRAGLNKPVQTTFRARIRRSDGSKAPVEIRPSRVIGSHKPLVVLSMRSMSDEVEAEERLRSLAEDLTHLSRVTAMGEMAADITHEINQPLAALTNFVEAARLTLPTQGNENVIDLLGRALDQAHRAGTILKRLRSFVTKGELKIRPESVEDTIRDAVSLVMVGRLQFAVRVNLAFDRAANVMMADRVQVQQVIVNLLRNAVEAVQQCPPDRRDILVRAVALPDFVEISVADTGVGLAEGVIERLYEPFYSTKAETGMGVGLAISRRIVEAHGGQIWAENRENGGACFRFTIPLPRANAQAGQE